MNISASDFKAQCLAILDRVNQTGETVTITKRGRVVARLVPPASSDDRPWLVLRSDAEWIGDPFEPVVDDADIEALK